MKCASTIFLATLMSLSAVAQPTITSASFFSAAGNHQYRSYTYQIQPHQLAAATAILAATGGNQTYDFAQFAYAPPIVGDSDLSSSTAGTPAATRAQLSSANYNWHGPNFGTVDTYSFFRLDSDSYAFFGSALLSDLDNNGVTDTTWTLFDPPLTMMVLPLTSTSQWMETVVVTTVSPFGVNSVSQNITAVVEGWGSLILPDRTLDALRLKTTRTIGTSPPFTLVQFITNGPYSASIIPDGTGSASSGDYGYTEARGGVAVEVPGTHDFELQQNYPNPFGGDTTIPVELSKTGHVTLSVVDLLGREVARPLDTVLPSGKHEVHLDGRLLTPGFYLYRLSSPTGTATRQMVVLR